MRRALVTGAAGFAGRYLVEFLAQQPDLTVHATVHRPDEAAELGRQAGVGCDAADLADPAAVRRLVEAVRPDLVFHLAAQTFVPASFADPAPTLTGNVLMQLHLLEAIRAAGLAPRVLVVGSNEEYGLVGPEDQPIAETTPFRPNSPYAVSKIAQDMLGLQYFNVYRLPIVRVRPFNHTGPRQSDRFVVSSFARQVAAIEAGQQPPIIAVGNLEARRDFTDVRDVVRAYWLALERGTPGDVYNVGSGVSIPIRQVLDWLIAACRVPVEVRIDPARLRPSDVPETRCDASKLRAATGWAPTIDIHQTVLELLDWWRKRVLSARS